ncbi:MAG: hypothetical protein UV28_C0003G0034 [Candidatus Collierbacteria bacterium GW2011_GWE2_42_48]|nr:MAG: hypothetical protein UV28_C0003G0034 [Candidatus Collierbacteria bacterium GW2011_GWE2_42_48]KKS63482.1 MAG: hypothetical protein UV29_C0001G0039 [Candidatus Collierbacteria bacterium GW2011_GWD2_42_50]KKS64559.1 MAG: hypothetical protein UV32_C0012G0043 [Candidatus Collierbacteria bacterium GW2011_GWF2_42_51]
MVAESQKVTPMVTKDLLVNRIYLSLAVVWSKLLLHVISNNTDYFSNLFITVFKRNSI